VHLILFKYLLLLLLLFYLRRDKKLTSCSSVFLLGSSVSSLVELNTNNNNQNKTVEFASGHMCGEIKIWSKRILNSQSYSVLRRLQPFNNDQWVHDLLFLNEFNCLISCCSKENKIVIYRNKGEKEEKEELKHEQVSKLVKLRNGVFASGGSRCLKIWTPYIY
jgi:WD40 repeat protein